jgi:hypothetical protein
MRSIVVGDEGRIMDDKSSILNVDGPSHLKVVCGPPGIGAKFQGNTYRTITHPLTSPAMLLLKVLV